MVDILQVTGSVEVSNLKPVTDITGTVHVDNSGFDANITASVDLPVHSVPSVSTTVVLIPASTSSVTLLLASDDRLMATFQALGSARLYIKCGEGASVSSFSRKLDALVDYFEVQNYTGIVTGIWSNLSGSVMVTDFSS